MDGAPLRARDVGFALSDLTDPGSDGVAPATADGALIRDRIDTWDGACDVESVGCAAYMSWEYRVQRDIFDDELGPLARDYVGSGESWLVVAELLGDPNGAWWDDVTTADVSETAPMIVARAMDEAGAELRAAIGEPDGWTWGRLHTVSFKEQTLGESGIGPLEWYFDNGPFPVAGRGRRARHHVLGRRRRVRGPARSGLRARRHRRRLRGDEPAELPLDDRHVRPRRGADHHHDRAVRQPRAIAHYGDMIEAWRTGGTVPLPFSARRDRRGGQDDADAAAVTARDLDGRGDRHRGCGPDFDLREDRGLVARRDDPLDEDAVHDHGADVAQDDPSADVVGDRGVRQRHHRLALADALLRVHARRQVEVAEDRVRPDLELHPRGREVEALVHAPRVARCATTASRSIALERHRVDRHDVAVLQALERDLVQAEPLLAVEEVGQAVAEHGDLGRDRAVLGEREEVDALHGHGTVSRACGRDHGTFVPAADDPTR